MRLENSQIAIELDGRTGEVMLVRDKKLGTTYELRGIGFELITDRGPVRSDASLTVEKTADIATVRFYNHFEVALSYRLGSDDRFAEKWLDVKAADGKPFFLKRLTLEDTTLGPQFNQIHFHDDNTIWQCPINLFLRAETADALQGSSTRGGTRTSTRTRAFVWGTRPTIESRPANFTAQRSTSLGVFRREGISRYSQGPYPGRVPAAFLTWNHTGLNQHFKGGVIPPAAVEPETLDWGEVWRCRSSCSMCFPIGPGRRTAIRFRRTAGGRDCSTRSPKSSTD